jgi:hypothetical protein
MVLAVAADPQELDLPQELVSADGAAVRSRWTWHRLFEFATVPLQSLVLLVSSVGQHHETHGEAPVLPLAAGGPEALGDLVHESPSGSEEPALEEVAAAEGGQLDHGVAAPPAHALHMIGKMVEQRLARGISWTVFAHHL